MKASATGMKEERDPRADRMPALQGGVRSEKKLW